MQRAADRVERAMARRHMPTPSEETLAAVRAGADAFLQQVVDVVRERDDRRTPRGERYDDVARRRREECLAPLIERELEGRREASRASARRAARGRAVEQYRSRIRGIFTAARDEALKVRRRRRFRNDSRRARRRRLPQRRVVPLDDSGPARRSGRNQSRPTR